MKGPFSRKHSKLFWRCVTGSLSAHFLFLLVLCLHPFWSAQWEKFFPRPTQQTLAYTPERELLEGAFDDLIVVSAGGARSFDLPHRPSLEKSLPLLESVAIDFELPQPAFELFSPTFAEHTDGMLIQLPSNESLVTGSSIDTPHPKISSEEISVAAVNIPFAYPQGLAKQDGLEQSHSPLNEALDPFSIASVHIPSTNACDDMASLYSNSFTETSVPDSSVILGMRGEPLPAPSIVPSQILAQAYAYGLPNLDAPQNWSHLFTVDVQVMPSKEEENGVFFAITLTPKPAAEQKSLKQNFHFIVDCSKESVKNRVSSYKRALLRSLNYLQEGQTFNIYFIDDKITALSATSLPVNKRTVQQAKAFLDKESIKGIDIPNRIRHTIAGGPPITVQQGRSLKEFQPVDQIITKTGLLALFHQIETSCSMRRGFGELDTVILFSDGNMLEKPSKTKKAIKEWLREDRISFVLYAATIGNDPHLPILDLVTTATGGKVLHSATHAAFPRKFAKLTIDLKAPIATQITPRFSPKKDQGTVTLMGASCKIAPIFAHQPSTFYGVADQPNDFTLIINGMGKTSLVEIPIAVSLKQGGKGSHSIRQIARQDKADHELSLFLENGQDAHFEKALEYLDSTHLR